MIGRCADTTGLGYADIDFERTTQEVVSFLAGLGHKHIAFINQSQSAFDAGYGPAVRTEAEFTKAMQKAGLEGVERFCRSAPQAGYEKCNELLAEHPDLTAFITMNERAIPGIMQAIADRKWRIPDDLSLVGIVSSARVAELMTPPLTTSDTPAAELGRLGVELLIQQLEAEEQGALQKLVPCRLTIRGSTGPCLRNPNKIRSMPLQVEGGKISET
jgi:DNA-binding LacI/PurR family transcriptional regulator